jgi:hypothetical protein
MELTDTSLLAYLHDSVVLSVSYQAEDRSCRSMAITVICDPEAGYPEWDGKRLSIQLNDVITANHYIFGAVIGDEQINAWGTKLSASMEAEVQRIETAGISCAGTRFSVTFHTGSHLEGICRRLFVEHEPE